MHSVRPRSFAYASVGVSLLAGGYTLSIDADERYTNVLTTHLDAETLELTVIPTGAVQDELRLTTSGIGLGYGLGVQAGLRERAGLFCELSRSGLSRTVTATGLGASGQALLTAMSDPERAAADPTWSATVARTVSLSGASLRVGLRYYLR